MSPNHCLSSQIKYCLHKRLPFIWLTHFSGHRDTSVIIKVVANIAYVLTVQWHACFTQIA